VYAVILVTRCACFVNVLGYRTVTSRHLDVWMVFLRREKMWCLCLCCNDVMMSACAATGPVGNCQGCLTKRVGGPGVAWCNWGCSSRVSAVD
jgi:hypothetical protein